MTQRQIRILHMLGTMNPGGVETWLMHALRNIDRNTFHMDFCTFGTEAGLYAGEADELGSIVLRCSKSANLWSFRRRFRRILREGSYQIAHSHVHLFSGALLRWAKAEGVPIRIAHSHNTSDGRPNTGMRRFYRRLMKSWIDRYATHGLAASSAAAVALFRENWQADGRFRVLHCGIDLHPFQEPVDRRKVLKELGIPADALVVGHVGRFDPQKNHRFLLDVARETLKRRPDVHFLLVCDGPLRVEIEALARGDGPVGQNSLCGDPYRCAPPDARSNGRFPFPVTLGRSAANSDRGASCRIALHSLRGGHKRGVHSAGAIDSASFVRRGRKMGGGDDTSSSEEEDLLRRGIASGSRERFFH
jgi:glycosyltransferase involved in cell wall biosynthesis